MIRWIARFIGFGFVAILLLSFVTDLRTSLKEPAEETAEHKFHREPKALKLSTDGPLGHFDKAQLQRGLKVYTEVCAACHGINLVAFRNLADLGYTEGQIKSFMTDQWKIEVPSINPDTGEAATRKPVASDRFPKPYPNEIAARAANNNAYPPDLSLIAKSREGGAAYLYSLLTGYQQPSAELLKEFPDAAPGKGLYHNPYFANLNIAMPPPFTADGQVTYEGEGQPPATIDQMAKDVSAFLLWTAEPKLEARKRTGITVLIFLLIATILGYLAYQNVWAEAKRAVRRTGPLDPANQAKSKSAKRDAGIAG
ncbi:cytochrome c1 [Sphingomonas mesophila]|uniref:cytochrome c1 n=1 Tax=Sphingomonas mesophila TaxID=2303576 RepID=UPI000E598809|nr:cytochrome c1 [Sphingomonas mesophila]